MGIRLQRLTKGLRPRPIAAGLLIAGLLGFAGSLLLRSPCLGVADNSDYWRVMRPAGIDHLEPLTRPGQFVRCELALSEPHLETGVSSPALLARVVRSLPSLFGTPPERLDLRQMGLVYLALTVVVVAVALGAGAPPLLLAAWLYVLVDPGYLLFFNSFYADPALLLALFGIGTWLVLRGERGRSRRPGRPGVGGAAALVSLVLLGGFSKMQYILLPMVTAAAVASLWVLRSGLEPEARSGEEPGRRRNLVLPGLVLVLLVLAAAAPYHFYRGPAPRFLEVNNYHAVYAGILQVTDEPEPILASLGIPARFGDLPRNDVWSGRVPLDHPVHEHLRGLYRWRLLGLWLSRPAALAGAAERIQETLATRETHRRGTFAADTGHRRWEQYRVPWQFSRPRGALFGAWPPLLWLVLAAALTWCGAAAVGGRWSGAAACGLFLALFALSQLVAVVLGDGFVALEQHLVGARFALDLLVVLLLYEGVRSSSPLWHFLLPRPTAAGSPHGHGGGGSQRTGPRLTTDPDSSRLTRTIHD